MIGEQPIAQLLAEDQALRRLNKIARIISATTNPEACDIKWGGVERDCLEFSFDAALSESSPTPVHPTRFPIIPFILDFPSFYKDPQKKHRFIVQLNAEKTAATFLMRLLQHEVETLLVGEQNFSCFVKHGLPHPTTGCGATALDTLTKTTRLFKDLAIKPYGPFLPYGIKLVVRENDQVEIVVDASGDPSKIAGSLCSVLGLSINDVIIKQHSLTFPSVDTILDGMARNRIDYQTVLVLNKKGELAITKCASANGNIHSSKERCLEPYYPQLDALGLGLRKTFGFELRDPSSLQTHSTVLAQEGSWVLFLIEADVWISAPPKNSVKQSIPKAEQFVSLSMIREKGIFWQGVPAIQHYLYFEAKRIEEALQAIGDLANTMVTIDSSFQPNLDNSKPTAVGDNFGKIYIKNSDGRISGIYEALKESLPSTMYPTCQIELVVTENTVILSNINPALVFDIFQPQAEINFCFKQAVKDLPAGWIVEHMNTLAKALDEESPEKRLSIIDKTKTILASYQQLMTQLRLSSEEERQRLVKSFIAEVRAYEQSILALSPTQKNLLIAFTIVGTLLGIALGGLFGLLGGFCLSSGANSAIPGLTIVATNFTGGGLSAALMVIKNAGLTVMISTAASSFLMGISSGIATGLLVRRGFFSPSQLLVKAFAQKLLDDNVLLGQNKDDNVLSTSAPEEVGGGSILP